MLKRKKSKRRRIGQSLVEYLVLLAVVVLGAIAGLSYFKDQVGNAYNAAGAEIADGASEMDASFSGE